MKFADLSSPAREFLHRHSGAEVLVVAMERAAADQIVRGLEGSHVGIHRYSFRQLVSTLCAPILAQKGSRPITSLSAEALAAQVIDSLELTYFKPVANTPGFPGALVETLTRLRLEAKQPPQGDLAKLAKDYTAALGEHALADVADQLEAAIASVELGRHPLLGLPTVLIDIRPDNELDAKFLGVLAAAARPCEVISANTTLVGPHACGLDALQNQLFADAVVTPQNPQGVEFFSASGEALECVEIARRILKSGYPFDECAILLRSPGRYQPLIEDALRRAQIPAWFTHGSVRPDSVGRAFLSLLHCAEEGLTASRFSEYLSHEQREQPFGWERLLVDASVIGGRRRWKTRLTGLAAQLDIDLQAAENDETRDRIGRQIDRLQKLMSFALPLIEILDGLRAPKLWGEWLDELRFLAEQAIEEPAGVLDLLSELEPMRDLGPVGLPDVIRVLSEYLGTLRREPKGNRFGQVFVGSIEEARGLVFTMSFVPGLCEGTFPKPIFDDPLLPGNRANLELRERLLLRQACATATEQVVFSWPRIELSSGRVRVPSFYVLEAARAATGVPVDRRTIERDAEKGVEVRIGWPAPLDPLQAIDEAEYDLARLRPAMSAPSPGLAAYLTNVNQTLARSMRTRWSRWGKKWYAVDGLVVPETVKSNPMERFRLSTRAYSPSALQLFARCPYRFGLSAIMGLAPMKEAVAIERLDPATRGSLFHEVQRRFIPSLQSYPASDEEMRKASQTLDRVLRDTAGDYAERLAPAIDEIWKNEVERLRADLQAWLAAVGPEHSEWIPMEAESAFEDAVIGGGWHLKGRMDLIEAAPSMALRVTDYKTGGFPVTVPEITGAGEVLQPLLYALVAERLYPTKSVLGGRLFYATLRGGYRTIFMKLDNPAREQIELVLSTIDGAIARGALLAAPRKDGCKNCAFIPICGPYEEERVLRKPQNELQALVQLREVK